MKKVKSLFLLGLFSVILVTNVIKNENKSQLSDLVLKNVEALAESESIDDFNKLGCDTSDTNTKCTDKNGNVQTWAKPYEG